MRKIWIPLAVLLMAGASLKLLPFFSRPLLQGTSFSQEITDRNGQLLRLTLSGDEKYRIYTPLGEVNPAFTEALLILEDQHFFSHMGLNPWSLVRAAYSTFSGETRMGGSTLTMQLVRIKYGIYSRSYWGKLWQILKSLEIESLHSKKEILEAYLNLAPYGANIEGVGAASFIYFNKPPAELNLAEILSLVVIPQSPQRRSLAHGEASGALTAPRERLFQKWLEVHPEDKNKKVDLAMPLSASRMNELPFAAPHFVNSVMQKFPGTKRIKTSLDLNLQKDLESRLKQYVRGKAGAGVKNAAALLLNYETMEVVSYIGSADFANDEIQGQVNGVNAKRSPGSTIKPFVYALALDQGLIHSLSILKDSPASFGAFDPENFDRQFMGPVNATQALIQSRNIPAVYLSSRLQGPTIYEFFKNSGIYFARDEKYYGLSVVLGGSEFTMLELAKYYAMLARHGELSDIRFLADASLEKYPSSRILSPEAAFITLDMLAQNPRPEQNFSNAWLRKNYPVAWKTGTSHGFRDAWTIGVVGSYVLAVWIGNFDNEANPAFIGRDLAAPLFFEMSDQIKNENFYHPVWKNAFGLNLKKEKVCSVSGHLPGSHCHSLARTWFIPGKSPIKSCDIHREVLISNKTGMRSCDPLDKDSHPEVFEFWPTDLLQIFKQAGIARKNAPKFDPHCAIADRGESGQAPQITSPKNDITYNISMSLGQELNTISLRAVADGDVKELYWFLGTRFLGKSEPDKALFWDPVPGNYTVRVVDGQGRSDSRELKVRVLQ